MTRVLSGAVLVALVVAIVWLAPPIVLAVVAAVVLVVAVGEYNALAGAMGLHAPVLSGVLALSLAIAVAGGSGVSEVIISGFIALAGILLTRGVDRASLADLGAALVPALYIGVPLGALVAVRSIGGPPALFLLMLTVMVSDTAQYYTGRLFGRRPLAPAISPKKTIEGAIGGFVFGAPTLAIAGHWWLPQVDAVLRVLIGVAVVALGMVGDLFESSLKRAAGVKDSSTLIPGHGGILDRIDALLFAAPVYYVVLKYV